MALSATAAAVNTAMNSLMAAMETHTESLTSAGVDSVLYIVPVMQYQGDAADSRRGQDATARFDAHGRQHRIELGTPVADTAAIPLTANGHFLFWKLTNDAGDLS